MSCSLQAQRRFRERQKTLIGDLRENVRLLHSEVDSQSKQIFVLQVRLLRGSQLGLLVKGACACLTVPLFTLRHPPLTFRAGGEPAAEGAARRSPGDGRRPTAAAAAAAAAVLTAVRTSSRHVAATTVTEQALACPQAAAAGSMPL
jgi:hypothetical protein